jgi:hypothetical protein
MTENISIKEPTELTETTESKEPREPTEKSGMASLNLSSIFSLNTILYIFIFLAVYFIIYTLLNLFFKDSFSTPNGVTNMSINIVIYSLFALYGVHEYLKMSDDDKKNWFTYGCRTTKEMFNNPNSMLEVVGILLFLYMAASIFKIPAFVDQKPSSVVLLEKKAWIFLLMLVILNFFRYALGIPIVDIVYDNTAIFWNNLVHSKSSSSVDAAKSVGLVSDAHLYVPDVYGNIAGNVGGNASVEPPQQIVFDKEVFNISNNLYTFNDAENVCKAYDATLASYDQIEESYKKGAEWCNYGWSKDQMALFPTQKSTWDAIQGDAVQKNRCGRPGINGGHISDPNKKYGVNCYGVKPIPTPLEASYVNNDLYSSQTITNADKEVEKWKNQKDKMRVSPYNFTQWSEYYKYLMS